MEIKRKEMIKMNVILKKICILVILISLLLGLGFNSYAAASLPAENAGPDKLKSFFKNYGTDTAAAKKFRKMGSEANSARLQKYKATLEEKSGTIPGEGNLMQSFKNYRDWAIKTGAIANRDYDASNIREQEEMYISGYASAKKVSAEAKKFLEDYYTTYKTIVDLTQSVLSLEKKDAKNKSDSEKKNDVDEMKKWSAKEIFDYFDKYDGNYDDGVSALEEAYGQSNKDSILSAWKKTIEKAPDSEKKNKEYIAEKITSVAEKEIESSTPVYKQPTTTTTGDGSSEKSLEDMTSDADKFLNSGNTPSSTFLASLQNFSKTIYNIMLTIGIFLAVIIGGIIGIKLMVSSASEKAEAKKLLVPYVVGCVVVFGGFGIWKLVVTILQGI